MNEIYSFHKKLNKKKVFFLVAILFFIFSLTFFLSTLKKDESISKKIINPNKTYYSTDKLVSLVLPKDLELVSSESSNHILALESKNNFNIYISKEDLIEERTIEEVIKVDQKNYEKNFKNISNSTLINTFNYKGSTGYTYSFHYLDSITKTTFYFQTFWIEFGENYYIVDIECPKDDIPKYSTVINNLLNNLTIK